MFVICGFMEERECGWFVPFNLDHKCVSLSMLVFLFFMKIHGSMTPIGALDYGKMRSYEYLKIGKFAIWGDLLDGFWKDKEKN